MRVAFNAFGASCVRGLRCELRASSVLKRRLKLNPTGAIRVNLRRFHLDLSETGDKFLGRVDVAFFYQSNGCQLTVAMSKEDVSRSSSPPTRTGR